MHYLKTLFSHNTFFIPGAAEGSYGTHGSSDGHNGSRRLLQGRQPSRGAPGAPKLDLQWELRHGAELCLAKCALLSSKDRRFGQPLH